MSPPGLGRFSSARAVSVVDVLGFCGLMRGVSSLTVMDWFAVAICRVKSTVCLWPSPATTELFCCASNVSASARTE